MTLNNLGGLLTKMGSIEEAKKKLEKALELRLGLLKKYPENLLYLSLKDKHIDQLFNFFISPGASVFPHFARFALLPPINFKQKH